MKNDVSKFVGQQIKKFRKQNKLTQKQLGEKIGVKHNTISSYENGTNEPDQDMLFAIAGALGVSIDDLFPNVLETTFKIRNNAGKSNELVSQYIKFQNKNKEESVLFDLSSERFVKLPVYGQISCGNGKIIFESPIDHEIVPKEWLNGGEYIMLLAEGDSMTGSRIFSGDKLLIRIQDEVENGEIAAVCVGDEVLLKKVSFQDNLIILESTNENYPTRIYDLKKDLHVKIIGKLKKAVTDF